MLQTYSPAVLIIDDDRGVTEYLREKFHEQTSVGVLVANDLNEAKQFIDDKEISFDAIIADIFFEKAKKAPNLDLNDGIDILNYGMQKRNGLKKYVLSFWADREREHERVKELKLDVAYWLKKMVFSKDSDPTSPWAVVERDLLKGRFAAVKKEASDLGIAPPEDLDSLSDLYRKTIQPVVRTFIQPMESERYVIVKPIEILCIKGVDGQYRSHPRKIGLFEEGVGETIDESINELAKIIIDQYADFEVELDDHVHHYARVVRDQLAAYVARKGSYEE
jgi:hypothetical protein